jgi:hypothetical protein
LGGGSGGSASSNGEVVTACGGGGVGARGGVIAVALPNNAPQTVWGIAGANTQTAGAGTAGGQLGGGSGSTFFAGGVGGIVVEWFYD